MVEAAARRSQTRPCRSRLPLTAAEKTAKIPPARAGAGAPGGALSAEQATARAGVQSGGRDNLWGRKPHEETRFFGPGDFRHLSTPGASTDDAAALGRFR